MGRCLLTAGLACIAVLTTPTIGAAQDGSGDAVTIETDLAPLQGGTFEVTEGADALGCSSGTADAGTIEPRGDGLDSITKTLTCDSGPNTGTFTIVFLPDTPPGGDQQQGPWEITTGTGDFEGLQGGGDATVVFPGNIEETMTGTIQFADSGAETTLPVTGSEHVVIAVGGLAVLAVGLGAVHLSRRLVA